MPELREPFKWNTDKPRECGYYLATWQMREGGRRFVSELWFNPSDLHGGGTWWASRGYLEAFSGRPRCPDEVRHVIAWTNLPSAYTGYADVEERWGVQS